MDVWNDAAIAAKTPKNRNEPPNEAVAHETISDPFDANSPNTEVDAQWADTPKEGSDHSYEHIPRVAPLEENQQHIQIIAHDGRP